MGKTCFFTGHRRLSADKGLIRRMLDCAVLDAVNDGTDTFIAGGALGFDMLAAQSVARLKYDYNIKLWLYLPHRGHTRSWQTCDKNELELLIQNAAKTVYISEEYDRDCMRRRNEAMVRASDCGIAWYEGGRSGTLQTLNIAKKRGIFVRNIFSEQNKVG